MVKNLTAKQEVQELSKSMPYLNGLLNTIRSRCLYSKIENGLRTNVNIALCVS